ncbi:MAG: hypothetical protein OEY18_11865, partial [Candidatus Aminicenantes bacterium]|nr:hypothetical protein [Candidatus Aminicenantes bacterium]
MRFREVLQEIRQVRIPREGYPVEEAVAKELVELFGPGIDIRSVNDADIKSEKSVLYVAVASTRIL